MERWMAVHGAITREEWEATQPKPEPDQWDAWQIAYLEVDPTHMEANNG